jgi:hypothetical protein
VKGAVLPPTDADHVVVSSAVRSAVAIVVVMVVALVVEVVDRIIRCDVMRHPREVQIIREESKDINRQGQQGEEVARRKGASQRGSSIVKDDDFVNLNFWFSGLGRTNEQTSACG